MSNGKLETLLKEISKCGRNSCSISDEYNIFEVLGVEYKEVIMCRFIGNLLEPKGKHGLGTEPLRLFIRNVLHDEDFGGNLEEAIITLEDSTDNGRRVDIVIYLKAKIYPIEVKIWADDQNEQLKDYYKFYFGDSKDAQIYYLTPNKHSPSDKSKGEGEDGLKDEQIVCISFTEDIKNWLTEVCNIKDATEPIISVIRNFREVIDKMAKDSNELKMIKDMLKQKPENSDEIKGAILLLKHHDEIWNEIRRNYIRKILDCGDTYELCDCDKKVDGVSHIVLSVKNKGNVVAWICVETNLYIVAPIKQGKCTGWASYNDKHQWKYITDDKSQKIQLNAPRELQDDLKVKEGLEELLAGVVDKQDIE